MVCRPVEQAGRCISRLEVIAERADFVKMKMNRLMMEGQCKGGCKWSASHVGTVLEPTFHGMGAREETVQLETGYVAGTGVFRLWMFGGDGKHS
jgi:ribulose kinase